MFWGKKQSNQTRTSRHTSSPPATQLSIQPWPASGAWFSATALTLRPSDAGEKHNRHRKMEGQVLFPQRAAGHGGEVRAKSVKCNFLIYPFQRSALSRLYSLQRALTSNLSLPFHCSVSLDSLGLWRSSRAAEIKSKYPRTETMMIPGKLSTVNIVFLKGPKWWEAK